MAETQCGKWATQDMVKPLDERRSGEIGFNE
jgi:hypothetical protein